MRHDAGNEIIVLDAACIGDGASGRAKGLVVPGFQVPLENLLENAADARDGAPRAPWSVPGLVQRLCDAPPYTRAAVEEMYDLTYGAMDRLRAIVRTHGIECDWVDGGAVEGSIHAPSATEATAGEEEGGDDGCRALTSAQVDTILGRSADEERQLYKCGEYDPSCAGVNPLALTIGLADAVESFGVQIFEHTKVTELQIGTPSSPGEQQNSNGQHGAGKYSVVTENGHVVRCDHVVLCTGAGELSTKVSKRLSSSFVPVYTWMAATEPLREQCPLKRGAVEKALRETQAEQRGRRHPNDSRGNRPAPLCGDDHVSLNYWRNDNTDEGRLLFGSLADTYPLPRWVISWRLKRALTEIYPRLGDVQFSHVWGGKLAFALNAMPLIGRDTDYDTAETCPGDDGEEAGGRRLRDGGVWYATGFAGHGIVPTVLAGGLLADAILGTPGCQQWRLFHTHFPPAPWNGRPGSRLGVGLALRAYDAHDWLSKRGWPLPPLPKLW